ncbi:hypothetical protein XA68_17143 [Ophiocordyceps unilateralis]|uniref:Altered inheritance of mitochondria protein 41 n=1 Tax=Ophiocordyceps unilateralis TaxID=268505 RepID=A0A2A9P5C9_OPHUN|nr:hypothetical protein XA68_17143 [Ophiocordyceps unilateralis]
MSMSLHIRLGPGARLLGQISRKNVIRSYSTTAPDATPPFLQKLKGELKSAMKAKDAPRLSVLRAIMSANINASKTTCPIKTDVQLVAVMRKILATISEAATEARTVGRQDLVEAEEKQMAILSQYMASSGVQTLGEAELSVLVRDAVDASKSAGTAAKALVGDVMRRLSGAFEGKDVDKSQIRRMVEELTG